MTASFEKPRKVNKIHFLGSSASVNALPQIANVNTKLADLPGRSLVAGYTA